LITHSREEIARNLNRSTVWVWTTIAKYEAFVVKFDASGTLLRPTQTAGLDPDRS